MKFFRKKLNISFTIILLAFFVSATVIIATGMGAVWISPPTTAKILFSKLPFIGDLIKTSWHPLEYNIIIGLRLPRVFLGMIVGASLAVCGVTMQALVRNRMADPFVLGVSSGASAFATLGMLFGAF